MTDIKQLAKNLRRYNAWRRDEDSSLKMPNMKDLGEWIEEAANTLDCLTEPNPTLADRVLTPEAQAERDDFQAEYGYDGNCSCHISPPCNSCIHPGNPRNQEEDESAWVADGCGACGDACASNGGDCRVKEESPPVCESVQAGGESQTGQSDDPVLHALGVMARVASAARDLLHESEEFDFPDGLGRGAPQRLWDALGSEIEAAENDGAPIDDEMPPADPVLLASANRMLSDRLERVAHELRGCGLPALADVTGHEDLQMATAALSGAYQMALADAMAAIRAGAQRVEAPSSNWSADGKPDPHGKTYDCERAGLHMGNMTDDELANGAFLNYDQPLNVAGILAGTHHSPIAWMTAVKDRIRWLSRSLEKAVAERDALTAELEAQYPSEHPTKFFCYSEDIGYQEFGTLDGAITCAESMLSDARDNANFAGEWSEEETSISYGSVIGEAVEIVRGDGGYEYSISRPGNQPTEAGG